MRTVKTQLILALAVAAILLGIAAPAGAQQINGVLLNNSYFNATWNSWDSIYGTNLPTASGTYVYLTYPSSYIGGFGGDYSYINASTTHQTYWYDSATQINVYLYAQNNYGGHAQPGCVAEFGGSVCDTIAVCGGGVCTNTFTTTLSGLP